MGGLLNSLSLEIPSNSLNNDNKLIILYDQKKTSTFSGLNYDYL